jgi:uncharacterized membrane-anchored protein
MKRYKWIVILVNLALLLVFFNHSIIKKEQLLSNGKLALLKLAPVDPRSLMQGDYMRLNYEISGNVPMDSIAKRGYCVVKLDSVGVAYRVRLQKGKTPVFPGEYLIRYNAAQWNISIGADSYFFEEGQADKYAVAKYGGIKVDDNGNSVLEGLYDEKLRLIK